MNLLTISEEFTVGKHNIGYVNSRLFDRTPAQFEPVTALGSFQTLKESMTNTEIESDLKPGFCTLGDVLAFLYSTNETFRNGYSNLFYLEACVVRVYWDSYDRHWRVRAWERDDRGWDAGDRVFSPADRSTQASKTQDLDLESLNARVKKLEALINPELLK